MIHYLNGSWVDDENLKISAFDLSVVRGFGVFDFLRTYNKKPFGLGDHSERLFRSAKSLGITILKTKKEIGQIVNEGIEKNQKAVSDFNIRLVITGGVGKDSLSLGKSSLIIIFAKAIDYPQKYYQQGVKVITFKNTRTIPQAKSLDYQTAIIALQKAKKEKAVEAIYVSDKSKILEGTTSNFFAVIDDRLVTPKDNILLGITRKVIIDLAKKLKIRIFEKDIHSSQIKMFSEAFITASNKEIMPVVKIDEMVVGNGRVGKITKQLMKEFWKITRNYSFLSK